MFSIDVACDGRTYRQSDGATSVAASQRGDTFVVEGTIYPGGTIPAGENVFSPDRPGVEGECVLPVSLPRDLTYGVPRFRWELMKAPVLAGSRQVDAGNQTPYTRHRQSVIGFEEKAMRIINGLMVCLLLGGGTGAWAGQRPRPPQSRQSMAESPTEAVRKAIEQFRQAWEANDVTGLRRLCAEGIVLIGSGRRDQGIEAVLESIAVMARNFPHRRWELGEIIPRIIGPVAVAHGEAHLSLETAHGSRLDHTGFVSFVLERQRTGWKIALADFTLRTVESPHPEADRTSAPSLEGAWLLESVTNVVTKQGLNRVAMALFTASRYSLVVLAPGRRLPEGKPLADYSKKDLLELVRGFEATTGSYQRDGDRLIILPAVAFLPHGVAVPLIFENVKLTADRLSYQAQTPDGRWEYLWRRLE